MVNSEDKNTFVITHSRRFLMRLNRSYFNLTLFCTLLYLICLTLLSPKTLYAKDSPLQVLVLSESSDYVFKAATQVEYHSGLAENPPVAVDYSKLHSNVVDPSKLHVKFVVTSLSLAADADGAGSGGGGGAVAPDAYRDGAVGDNAATDAYRNGGGAGDGNAANDTYRDGGDVGDGNATTDAYRDGGGGDGNAATDAYRDGGSVGDGNAASDAYRDGAVGGNDNVATDTYRDGSGKADTDIDINSMINTFTKLSDSYEVIMLSIMPGDGLSEEDYSHICLKLDRKLKENGVLNVALIGYPRNLENLALYRSDVISGIGVVIEKVEDLKKLEGLYSSLNTNKPLFIQDGIRHFYRQDVVKGVKTIYEVYYTLGVKYSNALTFLVPYSIWAPDVSDSPDSPDAPNVPNIPNAPHVKDGFSPQYRRTYDAVLAKTQGVYSAANQSVRLSGETDLILWGDRDLFKDTAYVEYKWNDSAATQRFHFPYPLTIDTTTLHDGLSRLRVIGYDTHNKVLWRKTVELDIYNNLAPKRASRLKASYAKDQKTSYKGSYIPVLMYHYFSEGPPGALQSNYVRTGVFEEQLQALLKHNYTPITFYDLQQYVKGKGGLPSKPILITSDDGYLNNYTQAYPLLKKYNVQATFFVSTAFMEEENDIGATANKNTVHAHFNWQQAQEMEKSGLIDIQIHGHDHTRFTNLSAKDLTYQISLALGLIEKNLGKRDVVVAAYPEFKHNASTVALLSKMNIDFQVTDLARVGTVLQTNGIKRINVPSTMSGNELISTIERITR